MTITVQCPSRLHLGLLSFPAGPLWPDRLGREAIPARRFGGVGLMVAAPGVQVTARPAADWSAEGPLASRALEFARRFTRATAEPGSPQHLTVGPCAPEHSGLGTGTQLGLAVGRALALAWGLAGLETTEVARRVGRGERSALGIHGFERGGFLVDGGKGPDDGIAPLTARLTFPEEWRVVLALPTGRQGLHGLPESQAFQRLDGREVPLARTDALCRLVLLGLLPALAERDLHSFGEALHDFNARAGEVFAPLQGGVYASPEVAGMVEFVRRQGVAGVGQSSWGPAVFAVVGEDDRAGHLARRLRDRFGLAPAEVCQTPACNRGAIILEACSSLPSQPAG